MTVVSSLHPNTLEVRVPEINWPGLPYLTGGFGYWTDAGQDLYRVATTTAYGMSVLPMVPLFNNYSYELEFFSPALKCGAIRPEAQAAFDDSLGEDWEASTTKEFAYQALVPSSAVNESDSRAFSNELWLRTPDKNLTCQTWNVSYTARIEFQNSAQSILVIREVDLERFLPKTNIYEVAWGEDPRDAFGYRSWLESIVSILEGGAMAGGAQFTQNISTKVLNTGLLGCPEMEPTLDLYRETKSSAPLTYDYYCRNGSLEKAIEDLGRNLTFSLFGYANGM